MSHTYPLARTARDAITTASDAARSRADAVAKAGSDTLVGLETEWLTLDADEADTLLDQAAAGPGHGFLQRYEDASGNLVLAVTYWKTTRATVIDPLPVQPAVTDTAADEEDETDDLYFRNERAKRRRKPQPVDPNQLDMFANAPDKG